VDRIPFLQAAIDILPDFGTKFIEGRDEPFGLIGSILWLDDPALAEASDFEAAHESMTADLIRS